MLSKNEKDKVFNALEKLFNLKGVFNRPEQIKDFVEHFAGKNYHVETVLQGINRLVEEPLDKIDVDRVEASIKAAIPHKVGRMFPNCQFCEDIGLISMVFKQPSKDSGFSIGHGISLACKCPLGAYRQDLITQL